MRIGTWRWEDRWASVLQLSSPWARRVLSSAGTASITCADGLRPARYGAQAASIDHIAVPADWHVTHADSTRVPGRLSDHDVYWIEVARERP